MSEEVLLKSLRDSITNDGVYKNYICRLNTVKRLAHKDLVYIMKHPLSIYPLIQKSKGISGPSSIANYITAICKLYSCNEGFAKTNKKHYDIWKEFLNTNRIAEDERYKENKPTERQKQNYISFEEVEKKLHELSQAQPFDNLDTNLQYLLLAFLITITPKRADLGNVKIFKSMPRKTEQANYIVLTPTKTRLILNKYKTAYKFKTLIEPLNANLVEILRQSLAAYPRDYIFGFEAKNEKGDLVFIPYEKNNSYSKYVQRTFQKLFGKETGVSLWRHIYVIEKLNPGKISTKEHEEKTRLMGHSMAQQRKVYQWMESTVKNPPESCQTTCTTEGDEQVCTTRCVKKQKQ
jgi:hypothetical protein